uniref:Uncharacterized protein n=1 Tax=Musca domestica TaxID=7370 RepID=A0A1I8N540_MUSDO
MRDYPSVPNVFRVASSHSVDTDSVAVVVGPGNGDIKTANANFSAGQLRQHKQKQQQQQQQNGNISGHQQPLVKSSGNPHHHPSTAVITASASASSKSATSNHGSASVAAAGATAASTPTPTPLSTSAFLSVSSTSLLKTFGPNKSSDDSQQRQQQQQFRQTAHASIETPASSSGLLGTSQLYLHSPYATLPRNPINISQSSLSLHSVAATNGGDIYARQQQHQQQPTHNHISLNSNHKQNSIGNSSTNIATTTTPAPKNNNTPPDTTNEGKMMGVINTISGSIPSTGFPPIDHGHTNATIGPTHMGVNGRTMSVASDLNQRDFRQVPAPAQQPTTISNLEEFTPYRRSVVPPCTSTMERNTGGYLWIITPVAASISVAIVIAALAGPQWLFTEEKQPNTNYNGTANFNVLDDGAFITRYTKSSLWIICSTVQGEYVLPPTPPPSSSLSSSSFASASASP